LQKQQHSVLVWVCSVIVNFKMNEVNKEQRRSEHGEPLAIIGMAVRLPGADSIDEFWESCG